jgi:hypothetical protein
VLALDSVTVREGNPPAVHRSEHQADPVNGGGDLEAQRPDVLRAQRLDRQAALDVHGVSPGEGLREPQAGVRLVELAQDRLVDVDAADSGRQTRSNRPPGITEA